MTDSGQQNHLLPQTLWQKLYLSWFIFCFLMVWVGTWAVNEPIAVMGLPLVYAWCSGWGIIWLCGCLYFGLKIEQEDAASRGD
ncbi:MAG: hypothetical protein VX690_01660 [Pseudomonadota bacterium]|nr:hypothetical protein [Pseudomonadota bacterium]